MIALKRDGPERDVLVHDRVVGEHAVEDHVVTGKGLGVAGPVGGGAPVVVAAAAVPGDRRGLCAERKAQPGDQVALANPERLVQHKLKGTAFSCLNPRTDGIGRNCVAY